MTFHSGYKKINLNNDIINTIVILMQIYVIDTSISIYKTI